MSTAGGVEYDELFDDPDSLGPLSRAKTTFFGVEPQPVGPADVLHIPFSNSVRVYSGQRIRYAQGSAALQ